MWMAVREISSLPTKDILSHSYKIFNIFMQYLQNNFRDVSKFISFAPNPENSLN